MKRILIVGSNSYIGDSICRWLTSHSKNYKVDIIGTINDEWRNYDFAPYSSIILVAGIVHNKKADESLYYDVNYKLALSIFEKSCDSKCNQFIFLSTGAVYGQNDRKHKKIVIGKDSLCNPISFYAKSKFEAEQKMLSLKRDIKLAIIRPPMVYGYRGKGNYNSLAKITKKFAILPNIKNERSMIFIDNFCEFIRLIIDNDSVGIFIPQDREYVCTTNLMKIIASTNGHKVWFTKLFNWIIFIFGTINNSINKAFGTYIYKLEDFNYFNGAYQLVNFETSILKTEKGDFYEK